MMTNEYPDRSIDPKESRVVSEGPPAGRPFLLKDPEEAPRRARFRRRVFIFAAAVFLAGITSYGAKVSFDRWALTKSYERWMRQDLARLAAFQADYHATHGTYATLGQLGTSFVPSQGVNIVIGETNATSWSATATHVRATTVCAVTARHDAATVADDPVSCSRS